MTPCVRHHHEWYDGSDRGYPDRLRGDAIPLPSRIILVADTVEAMTSDRPVSQGAAARRGLHGAAPSTREASSTRSASTPSCACSGREGEGFIRKDQKFDIYAFIEG